MHDATIITMTGLRPVQTLRAGERVITRGQGAVTVRRIEQISCVVRGIYVIAGSLGHARPDRDSLLPAGQTLLVRDWRARTIARREEAVMRVADLVDGEFVRDLGLMPMNLYRVFCDRPQILYADGLEMGSADLEVSLRGAQPA